MSTDGVAFIDDAFVPIDEARIPIMDWGFLHSDATYDVAHVWNGTFFRLDDHLDRFYRGMAALRMELSVPRERVRAVLIECVARSRLTNAYVEMIATRGVPPAGTRDPRRATNRFYAFAIPFVWIADEEKQANGLDLTISTVRRIPPASVDPTVKNYHWLDLVAGLFEAYDRGGETVVLTDAAEHIVEGPGFNVFAVFDGQLATPDTGVLEGITRRTVIELATASAIPLERRPIRAEELREADEVFLTSTAGGVIPVTKIDGRPIAAGLPGPLTARLKAQYWQLHEDPRLATPVSYR